MQEFLQQTKTLTDKYKKSNATDYIVINNLVKMLTENNCKLCYQIYVKEIKFLVYQWIG